MAAQTSHRAAMAPIVAAEVFLIKADFSKPYGLSKTYGTVTSTEAVLLKLTGADGIFGWGEANPRHPFTEETPKEAFDVLFDVLLPAVLKEACPEPGPIDRCLDLLRSDHLCAKGAVNMALMDILGKRLGVPVSTLLGGALFKSLRVLWPLSNGSAEEDILVIDEKIEQGFTTFMLKMGTEAIPIPSEIMRVFMLEERYGRDIDFIADANQGWSREEAEEFLKGVKSSRLTFVEQPVTKTDIEGMASLAKDSLVPISADECLTGLSEAGQIANLGAASIFSIKSSKNGGLLRSQRIASLALAFGIQCYMNSMLEFGISQAASLHLAMTLPNLVNAGHAFMSTLRLAEDPTNFSSFVRNGEVHLPDGPGLGIEVDEEHVRRLALEIKHLDGEEVDIVFEKN